MAGVFPGFLLAVLFILYIAIRCKLQPHLGPALPLEERRQIDWGRKFRLLRAGISPQEVTLADIYRSIIPFVLVMGVGLAIVMLFPQIALWLPNLYFGK